MIDLYDLPNKSSDTQIFYAQTGQTWQSWTKPRSCKFVYMMVFGGGGGGAGGRSGSGINRNGGGGGGSSVGTYCIFPATFLPDTLYVSVGLGGVGGQPDGNGTGGTASYISIRPDTTAMNLVLGCNGGNAGSSSGTQGNAGGSISATNLRFFGVAYFPSGWSAYMVDGTAGGLGTGAAPTNGTMNHIVTGGGGGGGSSSANTNANGATWNTQTQYPSILGGAGGGTNNGGNGFSSSLIRTPNDRVIFQQFGGAGGGANGLGTGGNGGNGGLACGGGGGGAGTTAGSGGNGGDGFVIIITY